jgi:hypothetical protein
MAFGAFFIVNLLSGKLNCYGTITWYLSIKEKVFRLLKLNWIDETVIAEAGAMLYGRRTCL